MRLRLLLALSTALLSMGQTLPFTAAELEEHRKWMNDAQEQQEEIRDAFTAQENAKVGAAAKILVDLTKKETAFWARTTFVRARELAVTNQREAQQLAASVAATPAGGKPTDATRAAFASLEKTCSACHGLQLEKSPQWKPRGK